MTQTPFDDCAEEDMVGSTCVSETVGHLAGDPKLLCKK